MTADIGPEDTFRFEAKKSKELLESARLAIFMGLIKAYVVHEELGKEGVTDARTNRFGETALAADIEAEQAVLDALSNTANPVMVQSEEHGTMYLNFDMPGKKLLAVVDGLDGSSVYKTERGVGRYGTMAVLFDNDNPDYRDYLAAGIMEHSTNRLVLAVRGEGVKIIDVATGEITTAHTNDTDELDPVTSKILVDSDSSIQPGHKLFPYFETTRKAFLEPLQAAGFTTRHTGSSAANYVDIATGAVNVVGEGYRKSCLEFASAYAIVTEAGGVMVTLDGQDLGYRKYWDTVGIAHTPVLTAANPQIASQILEILSENQLR